MRSGPAVSGQSAPSSRGQSPTNAPYIVRRVAVRSHTSDSSRFTTTMQRMLATERQLHSVLGYVGAIVGVALASLFISLVQLFAHFENISLVYLLVVLWLAAMFGRGPAIAASILAFLTYDFFFIPPLYTFTIANPTEWISLLALLATSLVLGQVTAMVRDRARDAMESQERTEKLYEMSQLIVSNTEHEDLLQQLAGRVVEVFGAAGVGACSIVLADTLGKPVTRGIAATDSHWAEALNLKVRERAAQAALVLQHGTATGRTLPAQDPNDHVERVALFVPLRSGRRVVGALGLAGTSSTRQLVTGLVARAAGRAGAGTEDLSSEQQDTLFAAFCDQIALALDHLALRQDAIHSEALRESDRLKTALLGSVTHDLRTPIATIRVAAGSLLDEQVQWSDAERRTMAETIEASADRLSRLVNNLLDLSRLESGTAVPEKRWYPIGDVISATLDLLDQAGRTEDHQFEVRAPEDLPLVPLDHAQIEQVLTNLIENAIKYSPPGSVIRVQARVIGPPRELEVRVVDQGIGIPPGEISAVFDKFYRVQHVDLPWDTERPPTGTGLGLAISAGIVHEHHGRIWAESEPGKGSTFIFTLPIPDEVPGDELPTEAVDAATEQASLTQAAPETSGDAEG